MSDKQQISRDSALLLVGTMAGQVIGLGRGLIVPQLVSPAQYGLWRLIKLIWQYGFYLHLGSMPTLNRELPGLAAKDRWDDYKRMRRTGLWGTLLVTVLGTCLGIGWTYTAWAPESTVELWAIRLAFLGIVAQQLVNYQQTMFRVRSEFGLLTVTDVAKALLGAVLMVWLGYLWGVRGLVWGMVLALGIVAFASFFRVRYDPPILPGEDFLRPIPMPRRVDNLLGSLSGHGADPGLVLPELLG